MDGATVPVSMPETVSKRLSLALRETESRWRNGKYEDAVGAANRGLAEPEEPGQESVRARLALIGGHAHAMLTRMSEARGQWLRAASDTLSSHEAWFCLAAAAYADDIPDEVLHFVDRIGPGVTPRERLLRTAALLAVGRPDDAEAEAMQCVEDPAVGARACWIIAAIHHQSENSRRSLDFLPGLIGDFSAAAGAAATLETPPDSSAFPVDLAWQVGVVLGAEGRLEPAERWFRWGAARCVDDPAFEQELGNLALKRRRWDDARSHFERVATLGDDLGSVRGIALTDALRAGSDPAGSLFHSAENLKDPVLLCAAGGLLDRAGRRADAARAWSRAIQIDPRQRSSMTGLGVLLAREKATERALPILRRAYTLGDRSDRLLRALSTVLIETSHTLEALPILTELCARHPEDLDLRRNLAGVEIAQAVEEANQEIEDDAIEILESAMSRLGEESETLHPLLAEFCFRSGSRILASKRPGAVDQALELFTRAEELGMRDGRAQFRLGLAHLEAIEHPELSDEGTTAVSHAKAAAGYFEAAMSAKTGSASKGSDPRMEIHRAVALQIGESWPEADTILDRVIRSDAGNGLRSRARWARSFSLARSGDPAAARLMLREAAAEIGTNSGNESFIRQLRLQMLKFRGAEEGAEEIEKKVLSIKPEERRPEVVLLYGIVLASQRRFDEAAKALEQAAKDKQVRSEADATRHLMQMVRLAELIREGKIEEATRFFTKIRSTLPPDPEIDLWLHAMENEGLPAAALCSGDGRTAVARWSSRLGSWRRAKDIEYWELVRSLAIAAHRTAVSFDKQWMPLEAERFWATAHERWLELFDAEAFWESYAARGEEIFGELEPGLLDEVRSELLEKHLVGLIQEVIGSLRGAGQPLVAADRFAALEQLQSWRLDRDPSNQELRAAVATCHAQRLIIYLEAQMWDRARMFGEKACETEPGNPVHFNNMAEVYGMEAQPLLAYLNSMADSGQGGPHLRPVATNIVDLVTLGLAWNPFHPHLKGLFESIAPQVGYTGVRKSDSRVVRAEQLRQYLRPNALENLVAGRDREETSAYQNEEAEEGLSPEVVLSYARRLKASGITDPEAIYSAILAVLPALSQLPKPTILAVIKMA